MAENEKAGLLVFQNEHHYYYLCRSVENNKPVVQLYKSGTAEEMELLASAELTGSGTETRLRIDANRETYAFYYAEGNNQWKLLKDNVDATFLSTAVAGGFVGCVFALYATSQGKVSSETARYNWFEYTGNDEVFK